MALFMWLLRKAHLARTLENASDAASRKREGAAVLQDLSRLFAHDETGVSSPDAAADIPLALGTMFRTQGDIDRAVATRESLLTLPDLPLPALARTWYELGRDYRAAGLLDRAVAAYKEARRLGHPDAETSVDLARLYADSGAYAEAAAEAARLEIPPALACYLVRQAEECAAAEDDDNAARLLKKALVVYPGSPEAGLALASIQLLGGNAARALDHLAECLDQTTSSGRLILLEGLYALLTGPDRLTVPETTLRELLPALTRQLAQREPDVTSCYYAGLYLQLLQQEVEAEQWFTKALVLDSGFWAARLALLGILAGREQLPPLLAQQVAFFRQEGAHAKRFLCRPCGMRRDTIFSECPRCRAWHSVAFRLRLQ